jgi:hypothetical protein
VTLFHGVLEFLSLKARRGPIGAFAARKQRSNSSRSAKARADNHTAIDQGVCQDGSQADADRERRLPPRLLARARPARRSRRGRTSHHGLEKRTAAHTRSRFKRKNGGFWRAQFCTEVARPKRGPARYQKPAYLLDNLNACRFD